MTPVLLLTDGYMANGSEPWRIPDVDDAAADRGQASRPADERRRVPCPTPATSGWPAPGPCPARPGLMHRIGGLEKQDITGNVNYDPDNHQHMVNLRARKVADIANDIPPQDVDGPASGKLLVLSWGGTYGACATAVQQALAEGGSVAHAHLRYLNPLPANLGDIIRRFEKVLIPELNLGQLRMLIRGRIPGRRRRPEQSPRQAVRRRRSRREDRIDVEREVTL